MNSDIADFLKSKIDGLNFVDRITGLVRPVIKIDVVQDDDNNEFTVRKIFPVSCDVTATQCEEEDSKYFDLVPNSDRRSIIYFEDRGVFFKERKNSIFHWTSAIRLVGWLNLEMFDTASCSISAAVIAAIVKQFPQDYENFNNVYQRFQVRSISEAPKSQEIFGQYSYSEETNQYLLFPYDYFALDLQCDFGVHENCINQVQIKEKAC